MQTGNTLHYMGLIVEKKRKRLSCLQIMCTDVFDIIIWLCLN